MSFIVPNSYCTKLNLKETEVAIKGIREFFVENLARSLNLMRVSAPLFVDSDSGLNDNLSGIEEPVSFTLKENNRQTKYEIVHSLAKWKRMALKRYNFYVGEGIYTNMNAIRKDENLDNLHSIYVDQFDWEKIISEDERTTEKLMDTVKIIYDVLKKAQSYTKENYLNYEYTLPQNIAFIDSEDLLSKYPNLSPSDREYMVVKEHKAVFLMRIGGKLKNGQPHDGRSPDYDDWNLNGDILLYYPLLDCVLEISSMGIRVNSKTLKTQLELSGCSERSELPFQKFLLNDELPQTIGGGIGQSRLCMFLLNKAHIGEVQASVWPNDMIEICKKNNIQIL